MTSFSCLFSRSESEEQPTADPHELWHAGMQRPQAQEQNQRDGGPGGLRQGKNLPTFHTFQVYTSALSVSPHIVLPV